MYVCVCVPVWECDRGQERLAFLASDVAYIATRIDWYGHLTCAGVNIAAWYVCAFAAWICVGVCCVYAVCVRCAYE